MTVPYSTYYKPMGDLPYISAQQVGGLILHHGLIIRTYRTVFCVEVSTASAVINHCTVRRSYIILVLPLICHVCNKSW